MHAHAMHNGYYKYYSATPPLRTYYTYMAPLDPKSAKEISYEVRGKIAIITINRPRDYGAMNQTHYRVLEELVFKAASEPGTIVTLIQGTGKFFSAGADVRGGSSLPGLGKDGKTGDIDMETRQDLFGPFAGRNSQLAETFWDHPKLLVCALNGPVIGLSAAVVACCDIIVGRESSYLLVPFANLSLVSEGGAGFTLPHRLGWSLANQALLASQPISSKDLLRVGFLNWVVSDSVPVDEFNSQVYKWINDKVEDLDGDSILRIKNIIRLPYNNEFSHVVHKEVIGGVDRFAHGLPQAKFKAMADKTRRHKL